MSAAQKGAGHTALPWKDGPVFGSPEGRAIFWTDESRPGKWQRRVDSFDNKAGIFSPEDAAFIVAAVNSHARLLAERAELVAALQPFVEKYDAAPAGDLGSGLTNGDFLKARALISKLAGGGK